MAVYFVLKGDVYKVEDAKTEDLENVANQIAENISNGVARSYKLTDSEYRVMNFAGAENTRVVDTEREQRLKGVISKRELGTISVVTPDA